MAKDENSLEDGGTNHRTTEHDARLETDLYAIGEKSLALKITKSGG